jgi:arginase
MSRKIKIIRVPLDLGQERRGVDMGPSALRVAGLNARVRALGLAFDAMRARIAPPRTMDVVADDMATLYARILPRPLP